MRWLMTFVLCATFTLGCKTDKGLQDKMDKAKSAEAAEDEAAAKAKAEAEAERRKALLDRDRLEEEARKKKLANQPKGNLAKDEDVAKDDTEKALLAELRKAGTHEKIAGRLKKDIEKFTPFLVRALQHHDENVRSQAIRVLIQRAVHTDEVNQGWIAALDNEDNDIVRENWGYDLRLYKDPALLPAAHRSFKYAQSPAAIGQLAEALMELRYEEAIKDVYEVLGTTEHTMAKQYLLSAIKRWPREDARPHVEKMLKDDKELIRNKAKEVLEAIEAAKAGIEPEEPGRQ